MATSADSPQSPTTMRMCQRYLTGSQPSRRDLAALLREAVARMARISHYHSSWCEAVLSQLQGRTAWNSSVWPRRPALEGT